MPKIHTLLASTLVAASTMAALPVLAETPFDYLRSYYATDAHLPQTVTLVHDAINQTTRRIDFTFTSFDNQTVPARLEIPEGVDAPPVIILMHGLTQSRAQWWRTDDGPYSFPSRHREALLKAGFAVLAIDARGHGDRMTSTDFQDPSAYLENWYVDSARKLIAETAIDVRSAIDALSQFEGIETDQIGLTGFSFGAFAGYLASAVDPRIDASLMMALPILPVSEGQSASFTSPFAYAPGFADKSVGFIAATEDTLYTREAVDALVAGLPVDPQVHWVESDHDLPDNTAALSVTFFKQAF